MKTCQICDKKPVVGTKGRHIHSGKWKLRAPKTKRLFKPNLQKVTFSGTQLEICTSCMRTLAKEPRVRVAKAAQ